MFCISCGKKISNTSVFCKYCGVSQKETVVSEQEKNKKLFSNSNPKKAWFTLWVTTVLTFILTLYICIKYTDSKITLLSGKILIGIFLFNILLGIFAFLAFAFSNNNSKNNKISFFTKYIFSICLIYLFINPFVFATEGYRALNNPEYGKKYQNITNSNPPKLKKESITLQNLSWRSGVFSGTILNSNNKPVFNVRIILKVSKTRDTWNIDETHEILVPYKIDAGQTYSFSEKVSTKKTNPWWTTEVMSVDLYNGENITTPSPTSKPKISNSNVSSGVSSGSIECIGPDGKHFNTSMADCKSLNEKWGKPLDYMTNCNYPAECGGGTRRESYSECMKPCTRTSTVNSNQTTQQSSGNNTYCWSNTYNYGYYTSSGDQCNLDNLKSGNYQLCMDIQKSKNDTCKNSCQNESDKNSAICLQNYGSTILQDGDKYGQCLNGSGGVTDQYGVCLGKCTDQYALDIKQCTY